MSIKKYKKARGIDENESGGMEEDGELVGGGWFGENEERERERR